MDVAGGDGEVGIAGNRGGRRAAAEVAVAVDEVGGAGGAAGGGEDGVELGEMTPIFYRRDRFEVLDHATFWLAPHETCAARGWDVMESRAADSRPASPHDHSRPTAPPPVSERNDGMSVTTGARPQAIASINA